MPETPNNTVTAFLVGSLDRGTVYLNEEDAVSNTIRYGNGDYRTVLIFIGETREAFEY